jgi:hypothetical protein
MTDKPKIEVGQRWITTHGSEVFIIADNARGDFPFVGQYGVLGVDMWNAAGELGVIDGEGELKRAKPPNQEDLVALLPPIIKREVALYRCAEGSIVAPAGKDDGRLWICISEPVTIDFTLLPGESE